MGFFSKFKFKTNNTTLTAATEFVAAPANTVIEKDDGVQYTKNAKGAWDKTATTLSGLDETIFMRKSANSTLDMNQYDITDGNTIYMDNWFRSTGTTGWYNETYATGIRATSSGVCEIYNNGRLNVNSTADNAIVLAGGIAIGSEVILKESTDRADLLQITSSTSGWAGLQITNSSNEGRWSFMTDGEFAGIYNDEDEQWHIYMGEAGATELRYAGVTKLATSSAGVTVTGALTASGNVTAYSDERVKTNINKIINPLTKLLQLNGYTFDRTDMETHRQTGVIAQEVQKVLPEVIEENQDGYLSVAYGNMAGLFIESIKELKAEVDALKAEIAALKNTTV